MEMSPLWKKIVLNMEPLEQLYGRAALKGE
jgi:hypothetical protein